MTLQATTVVAEPTSTEHFEVISLLYRLLQCVDQCEQGIRHAHAVGDLDLALSLEDVLSDAQGNVRVVREAIAARALQPIAPTPAPPARTVTNSELRAIRPRRENSWSLGSEEVDNPLAGLRAPLVIHVDGLWFQLPSGEVVDCGERRVMRRLLACLMQQRLLRPGEPVPVETLLLAGWPEEPTPCDPGKNRLRVMIVRLRRLGLHTVLRSHYRGGYLFDPHVPARVSGEQAA